MKRTMRISLLFLSIGIFMILFISASSAQDIKTSSRIQKLIDKAAPGSTVRVPSGVFVGDVVINKSIVLIGRNSKIEGTFYINSDNVKVRRFIFDFPGINQTKPLMVINSDNARIEKNKFIGDDKFGVLMQINSKRAIIYDNDFFDFGTAILIESGGGTFTIQINEFEDDELAVYIKNPPESINNKTTFADIQYSLQTTNANAAVIIAGFLDNSTLDVQKLIDDAKEGATIKIFNSIIQDLVINKRITLDAEEGVIASDIIVEADGVKIKDFEVASDANLFLRGRDISIIDNHFTGGEILYVERGNAIIESNTFEVWYANSPIIIATAPAIIKNNEFMGIEDLNVTSIFINFAGEGHSQLLNNKFDDFNTAAIINQGRFTIKDNEFVNGLIAFFINDYDSINGETDQEEIEESLEDENSGIRKIVFTKI